MRNPGKRAEAMIAKVTYVRNTDGHPWALPHGMVYDVMVLGWNVGRVFQVYECVRERQATRWRYRARVVAGRCDFSARTRREVTVCLLEHALRAGWKPYGGKKRR